MEIVFIRHPEIEVLNCCLGQTDVPLSEAGMASLGTLATKVAATNPDLIWSSDLQRCRILAEFISQRTKLPVEYEAAFRELNFGVWENRDWDEIREAEADILDSWMKDFVNVAPPGGESFQQLQARVVKAICERTFAEQPAWMPALLHIAPDPKAFPFKRVLIVSHAGAIRAALSHFLRFPLKEAFDWKVGYGEIFHLQFESGIWKLLPKEETETVGHPTQMPKEKLLL